LDKINLLSVSLINEYPNIIREFIDISKSFGIGLGWHYLLDLTWTAQQLELNKGMRLVDAGAGVGVLQWWLAEQGVDVISADRNSRRNLPMKFRQRYHIRGIRKEDLKSNYNFNIFLASLHSIKWYSYPEKLISAPKQFRKESKNKDYGTIYIYNQDLRSMVDITDESVDAIVSISALEHNPPEDLQICVDELMRILKPGGKLIVTMAAAKDEDWFHEPSDGWCYSELTLRKVFNLSENCQSNFKKYDELFESLKNCSELRDNLADFYFKSGKNGMPWGFWDPKYLPVGIMKIKSGKFQC
jgi:ubiquinone/menaquinone biosynthesis C-methylase UbiE